MQRLAIRRLTRMVINGFWLLCWFPALSVLSTTFFCSELKYGLQLL